jgi:recombination protein RecT
LTTALVPLDKKFEHVSGLLEKLKPAMGAALPKHMNPDRMARLVLTCIRKTPALLDCDPRSLLAAVMNASQLGLEIDGYEAHLVPFAGQVTLIPDYKGLVKLMWNSGMVESIQADVAKEGDLFRYTKGDDEKIVHEPAEPDSKTWPVIDGKKVEDGQREITHAYAIITIKGGGKQRCVIGRSALEALRKKQLARVRKPHESPWMTHFEAMCKKTALRQISKFVPRATDRAALLHYATQLEDAADAGLSQELLGMEQPELPGDEKPKGALAGLKEELKGKGEAPECAGCGKNDPPPHVEDDEGRVFHPHCLEVLKTAAAKGQK